MKRNGSLIAGLALAAAISYWLSLERHGSGPIEALPAARSDYRLENFELIVMNEDGAPRFVLRAPELAQQPSDGSATVRAPVIDLFEAGEEAWEVTAEEGWVRGDGEELRLTGAVRMQSLEAEPTEIRTPAITLFPDEQLARTDEPVDIRAQAAAMQGVGLRASLDTRRWELLSDVRARYQPPPR